MNVNKLNWLSEKIEGEYKQILNDFVDKFDKDAVSFVIDACYEKNPLYPSKLFLILKNAIEKRCLYLMENGEEYTTFDNLLFEKALNAFTYPYTFDKYMILEALCDVININPSCFDDTAINAITNKTAFSSKILLKLSLM